MSKSSKSSRQSLIELENLDDPMGEDEFPIGLGCALDMFREKQEVLEILNSLPQEFTNHVAAENLFEKYQRILDRYQEQPHLLDKHIEEVIEILITQVRQAQDSSPLKHLSLKFLRQVFKVRGPKEVVKRMPHEIADLVPVLTYLESENLDDPNAWESGYVLVMWLSILVINPFHLKLLDGTLPGTSNGDNSIAARLMNVCKKCLVLNNNIGHAAPFLVARFLTRPDMQEQYMSSFINWACTNITEKTPFGTKVGSFAALSAIFKTAKRQEILPYSEKILQAVLNSQYEKCDTVLRKAGTKLIQRIGMVFLRTKVAPWRYQRGSRSLLKNLQGTKNQTVGLAVPQPNEAEDENANYQELSQYSDAIESIIDKLLESLKDKDTVIRWSAAKGIGRVTNRLPKDYADEVVESLLQLFSPRESNGAWHGGCLAMAELARRGLLLPERLPTVIPVVKKAVVYDEIRGNFSLGSHVRDAACYVLWAFARAFEPNVVEPFVHEIATSLITVMLFDREINCRRAASAAFQENVGRQGNFPHGIDIVTVADYFSIGNRQNAFTNISVEIGRFQVYTKAMIDHLLELKYNHFDGFVRELAAEALGKLGQLEPDYMQKAVLPKLIRACTDVDTFTCNGALYSVGHIIVKLFRIKKLELDEIALGEIKKIIPTILARKARGSMRGNELIRQGLCFFIKSLAQAKLPFHQEEEFLSSSYQFLLENIANLDNKTKLMVGDCLRHYFLEFYYKNPSKHSSIKVILTQFSQQLKTLVMPTRQGFAYVLGQLPYQVLQENFPIVFENLLYCAKIEKESILWAESRRDAIVAITNILSGQKALTLDDSDNQKDRTIDVNLIKPEELYDVLIQSMDDYTTDKRGDIGSWVRDAAMVCIMVFLTKLSNCCKNNPEHHERLLNPSKISELMGLIAKQSVEKIDNIRVRAGKIFTVLLHYQDPPIQQIPERTALLQIFSEDFIKTVNWRSTSQTFPKFVELLKFEVYTYPLLTGFIVSGGSLSDSVMKDANGAVKNYIHASGAMGDTEVIRIGGILLQIFENYMKVERVTLPLLKFIAKLLQSNVLSSLLTADPSFGTNLIGLLKSEIVNSSRVEKIVSGIELLCELLQGPPDVVRASLKRLVVYLCHSFPRVRVFTSQKFYESLITYGDDSLDLTPENMEEVMNLLSETSWDKDLREVKSVRNRICDLMNVPQPTLLKPTSASNSASSMGKA